MGVGDRDLKQDWAAQIEDCHDWPGSRRSCFRVFLLNPELTAVLLWSIPFPG